MPNNSSSILTRLLLSMTAVILITSGLVAPRQKLLAQDNPTATPDTDKEMPSITVPEPVLNPPFTGDTYPDGWLKILGKSAYAVYLAPTVSQEREATFTGVWQPMIAQSGLYQVSAYLGVGEFSDYAAFYANVFPESTGLTRSAMYQINHADGSSTIEIDQSIRDSGWIDLGVFPFEAGANGTVTLTNQTDEADSTAVIALSSLRLTSVMQQETTPTPTETAVPASSPTPASTTEATAVPTTAPEPTTTGETLSLLNFGEPEFASSDIGERDEVEIPLIIDGDPVGRMSISYPVSLESTQADNINANIIVDNEFAEALKVALEDETTSEVVGDVIIRSQFYLTLDAASFDFDETLKTQRLTVFQGQPVGVAWNIIPKTGVNGRQDFNIKVILRFTDGIPEVSGVPPTFAIDVLGEAEPAPKIAASPTPSTSGRIADNLINNTAVLIGVCLSFIVGILGVVIAYLNYRKGKESAAPAAPAILDSERQIQLHRWLDHHFNDQELRSLCLEIGVDYDDLPFSGQSAKARELVSWCARNGRLDTLETTIRQHRPNLTE